MWRLFIDVISVIAPFILGASYVPQIWSLHKTKVTEGININFWYILNISLLMLFLMALDVFLQSGSYGMLVAQFVNLALGLVVLIQIIHYRK